MNYSSTQANNITSFIGVAVLILNHFGVNIGTEDLTLLAGSILSIVGLVANWIKRYKQGDLTLGGFRR